MKKILTQFAISTASFAAALLLFWGVAVVLGAWNEPGQTPPIGNVAAPITVGSANQSKVGTISAKDVWSDDADMWMSEMVSMKLKVFSLVSGSGWPNGYRLLSSPSAQQGIIRMQNTTAAFGNIDPDRVKALLVRATCYERSLYLNQSATTGVPPVYSGSGFQGFEAFAYRLCGGNDDGSDSNDAIVPVMYDTNTNEFLVWYKVMPTGNGTVFLDAMGYYYE